MIVKSITSSDSMRFVVLALAIAAVGYLVFRDPDVTFRSSDGQWADSEIQSKGRTYSLIRHGFERYKMKCDAPQATLYRVTPELWFNVFAWPSYLTDDKWTVPYSDAHPEIGYYYPAVTARHCYNEPSLTRNSTP